MSCRASLLILTLSVFVGGVAARGAGLADAAWDFRSKPIDRIPGGVVVGGETVTGWSDPLLFARMRLAEGDTDAVSETVNEYAEKFNLVLLANVKQAAEADHFLERVAVGFSTPIGGREVVITSNTHDRLGANLGFVGGFVFSGNESALGDVKQVARYRYGMVMDAPALMTVAGEHKLRIVRHFIWVSKTTGKLGTLVWQLDDARDGGPYRLVGPAMRLLPPNLHERRDLHVDRNEFNFGGIPGERAFALVRLPPGRDIAIGDELRRACGARRFNERNFVELLTLVAQAVAATR